MISRNHDSRRRGENRPDRPTGAYDLTYIKFDLN